MSYGMAQALQTAIYAALTSDATLGSLVGTDIYDALPSGTLPPLYVTLGPETVEDKSDATGRGALHEFTVTVACDGTGFAQAKEVAAAISDALVDANLSLARGRLVYLKFARAKAARVETGDTRQINLIFRARTEDAPVTL